MMNLIIITAPQTLLAVSAAGIGKAAAVVGITGLISGLVPGAAAKICAVGTGGGG